jgi:hypothetical protein
MDVENDLFAWYTLVQRPEHVAPADGGLADPQARAVDAGQQGAVP